MCYLCNNSSKRHYVFLIPRGGGLLKPDSKQLDLPFGRQGQDWQQSISAEQTPALPPQTWMGSCNCSFSWWAAGGPWHYSLLSWCYCASPSCNANSERHQVIFATFQHTDFKVLSRSLKEKSSLSLRSSHQSLLVPEIEKNGKLWRICHKCPNTKYNFCQKLQNM